MLRAHASGNLFRKLNLAGRASGRRELGFVASLQRFGRELVASVDLARAREGRVATLDGPSSRRLPHCADDVHADWLQSGNMSAPRRRSRSQVGGRLQKGRRTCCEYSEALGLASVAANTNRTVRKLGSRKRIIHALSNQASFCPLPLWPPTRIKCSGQT